MNRIKTYKLEPIHNPPKLILKSENIKAIFLNGLEDKNSHIKYREISEADKFFNTHCIDILKNLQEEVDVLKRKNRELQIKLLASKNNKAEDDHSKDGNKLETKLYPIDTKTSLERSNSLNMKQNKKTEPTQESKNILKPLKPLLVYRRKLSDNSNLGSFRDVKRQTMSEQSNKPEFKKKNILRATYRLPSTKSPQVEESEEIDNTLS